MAKVKLVPIRPYLTGGDKRSVGQVEKVIGMVKHDPDLFVQLIAGMTDADPLVRMRSADAVEKLSHDHPDWLQPYKVQLLGRIAEIDQQEVQWHVVAMIPRLSLNAQDRNRAMEIFKHDLDTSSSKIVQAFSMQAMFEISEDDPIIREEVVTICRDRLDNPSAAVRVRARNLLKEAEHHG